jgi:metal-responsive CopG/Arc/MetJ family transcriptional regulator
MPTAKPRVQVTIDDDLAEALDEIDPKPASRSRLIRDLALRGADAVRTAREQETQAVAVLLEIADGVRDYDLAAAEAFAASRGDRLP